MNNDRNPWKVLSDRMVYDNPWIRVTEYDVINPSGGKGIYGKVHFKNLAIGILPVDESGNTWLVGQYRFTLSQFSWEMPEGGGLLGTDPLDSARRELKEETGLTASSWTRILDMHMSNSVSDEQAIVYLAQDLEQGISQPEETELLQLKRVSLGELTDMVYRGEITDALTVASVLKLKLMMQNGEIKI